MQDLHCWIDKKKEVKISDDEIMTKQEIMDMKKEMDRIKEENEILKKAMAIFATKR